MLLMTTLFRLGLNVSSTRSILTKDGYAGEVIRTFGEFVIQNDVIVGLVIFLIIVLVQFIVITKGAERVAEVSARFTLDAMPGKQMAIDADLNAGILTREEAKAHALLEPWRARLQGKRALLYTGGVKSWSIISALQDLGMDVVATGVRKSTEDDKARIRELLGEYIRTVKGGTIEPHVDNNWKLVGDNWNAADHEKAVKLLREGKLALSENADSRTLPGKAITTAEIAKF